MPEDLEAALRTRRWGLPEAGGWKDQEAGLLERMDVAIDAYDALVFAAQYGSDHYKFAAEHPRHSAIARRIISLYDE